MPLKVNWTIYIEEDFLEYNLDDEEIVKTKKQVELALEFPKRLEKVQGFPKKYDIRKVRHRNFRIFLLLNWITENADCLRMFLNHEGYKKKQKNQILTAAVRTSELGTERFI